MRPSVKHASTAAAPCTHHFADLSLVSCLRCLLADAFDMLVGLAERSLCIRDEATTTVQLTIVDRWETSAILQADTGTSAAIDHRSGQTSI